MKVIQCPNGHFYDCDKYNECPHCSTTGAVMKETTSSSSYNHQHASGNSFGKSYEKRYTNSSTEGTMILETSRADDNKTVLLGIDNYVSNSIPTPVIQERKLVVGWIVCINGILKGNSYNLYKGKNSIGSYPGNSVVLLGDYSVLPNTHTWIAFDANRNFFVLPGTKESYVNGVLVDKPKYIKLGDIITIGSGTYLFASLGSKEFDWNSYLEN